MQKQEAQRYLDEQVERLRNSGLEATHVILEGKPAEAIIEYARTYAADLIALSTHGRTGLSGWNVVVVALIGDGDFGQNPALLATAFERDVAVVWMIMNNHAFGTIAGLEAAHYGTTFGTVFEKNGKPWSPDYAAIARAYGVEGVKIASAAEFKPALERAIRMNKPVVLDVYMKNEPVPTAGHWNIMDIYSQGRKAHHVATGA